MTADEINICRAFNCVTFPIGTNAKRLALNMADQAEMRPEAKLTPRQRAAILEIAIRFRRQIPGEIVELAKKLKAEAAT